MTATGADQDVPDARCTVEEVPGAQASLLAVDDQEALPREDEERLLGLLAVVLGVRLAGLEDVDVDAEVREPLLAVVERDVGAGAVELPRERLADVYDEPSWPARCQPA